MKKMTINKAIKENVLTVDYEDDCAISYVPSDEYIVHYDDREINSVDIYPDGDAMVIIPCGREHLDEIDVDADKAKVSVYS